jgi:hypothetical protein
MEELAPIADAGGRGTPIAGGDTREGSQDPSEPAGPCQRHGNWYSFGARQGRLAMKFRRRQFLHLAAGAVALPAVSRIARAQAYPSRPITMVVPFGAGGATDTIGRVVAEGMRASLGHSVAIENVAGASGTIGVGRVARAAPDGYTLGIRWQSDTRLERGHDYAPLRRAPRFRTEFVDRGQSNVDCRKEVHASKGLERTDCVAEG